MLNKKEEVYLTFQEKASPRVKAMPRTELRRVELAKLMPNWSTRNEKIRYVNRIPPEYVRTV